MMNTKKSSMTRYSSTKGQLNVDLVISYLLFIFFLIFLFQFIINLTTPFSNAMTYTREKQVMELLKNNIPARISERGIYESCLFQQEDVESMKTEFTIMGFPMPERDIDPLDPGQTPGSLVFSRKGELLKIHAGGYSEKNITVMLVFPQKMSPVFLGNTTESNDEVEIFSDTFGNTVVEMTLRINSTDSDELTINMMDRGMVTIEQVSGIDWEDVYIGNIPLRMSCGISKGGYSSVIEGFTALSREQKIFPIKYKANVWWFK